MSEAFYSLFQTPYNFPKILKKEYGGNFFRALKHYYDRYFPDFSHSNKGLYVEKKKRFIAKYLKMKWAKGELKFGRLVYHKMMKQQLSANFVPLLYYKETHYKGHDMGIFVYEYLVGDERKDLTLFDALQLDQKERLGMTDHDYQQIFFQVCFALLTAAYLEPGFRHNDLKPANIILQKLPHPINLVYRLGTKKSRAYILPDCRFLVKIIDYNMITMQSLPEVKEAGSQHNIVYDIIHLLTFFMCHETLKPQFYLSPIEMLAKTMNFMFQKEQFLKDVEKAEKNSRAIQKYFDHKHERHPELPSLMTALNALVSQSQGTILTQTLISQTPIEEIKSFLIKQNNRQTFLGGQIPLDRIILNTPEEDCTDQPAPQPDLMEEECLIEGFCYSQKNSKCLERKLIRRSNDPDRNSE